MRKSKKGQFTIGKLGAMLLVLVMVLILLTILKIIPNVFKSLGDCGDRGGVCRETWGGCADNEKEILEAKDSCPPAYLCCEPLHKEPSDEGDLTPQEQDYLMNAIILTLDSNPQPIRDRETIELKVSKNYDFHIKINDKLIKNEETKAKLGPCAVYVTDYRDEGKKYLLSNLEGGILEDAIDSDDSIMFEYIELNDCSNPVMKLKKFKPSLLDIYKDLTLHIILFDSEVKQVFDEYVRVSATPGVPGTYNGEEDPYSQLVDMYSNMNHWLAYRSYRLNVEPVVKVSDVSGAWVDKDKITISCPDLTCTRFGLMLVKAEVTPEGEESGFEKMVEECSSAPSTNFVYSVENIAGTTLKTTGIPLNINIGGFRIPTQKQEIKYITHSKPITVVKNKAEVMIDRAAMVESFLKKTPDNDLITGESTYLCVKADVQGKTEPAYGLSAQPIKVDVLPPVISDPKNQIRVIYPDPEYGTMPGASDQYTPYYYRQYPRVVIDECYDWGQSGCASYDYFIHTGDFVQLRSITADWETGVKALLLSEGLNLLFNFLSTIDPINTICPYMYSNDYMLNSHPEIRFKGTGQGVMCIRIKDRVGNPVIHWKELWTPENMFNKIAANASEEALNEAAGELGG